MGRYSARNFNSDRKNQKRRCWVVHLSDAELGSTTLPIFEFLATTWSSKMADRGQQAQLSQIHATSSFRPRILEGFLSKAQVENGWKWCKWLTDLQFSFLPFSNQTWQWETPRLVRWFLRQKKTSSFGDFQPCLMTQRRVCCYHQVYGLRNQHLTWKTGSAFHDDDRQTIISIHINHFFGDDLEMQPIFWETYEHSCCLFEMI